MSNRLMSVLPAALVLMVVVGCDSKPPRVPVTGRVVYKGSEEPVIAGKVVLESTESPNGSSGYIKEDGTFTLGTFDLADGVMPGEYRVYLVQAYEPQEYSENPPPQVPLVDSKYMDPKKSGITAEIPLKGELLIEVEHPPKSQLPRRRR
ncbi:hypothetical protein [Planctomycetes bacterium Pan216]